MQTTASQPRGAEGAPTRTKPVVACQNLTKVFKDFWMRDRARAVDSLSFEIMPHEIFGLLGPNGSGKSTTIKIILGLLRATSGRVAVFGKSPTDVRTKRRIGYLPEESYLYPFLNARETLDYYAKLFEIDRRTRTRRIDELLEMVGLVGAQYRPVREYSKGMQRRIGLAQALINDPDLLILDEPTTGLDPIGTRQVKDLIIDLGRRGKTVLLSSHLLADVEECVDRMVILYGGRKRDEGTCDDLLVTHSRTTIQTDSLDEDTVAAIDTLLRERTGGGILDVAHPRQRLEELFLDIVERAREDRVATSGAMHGGQTAAFLKGAEEEGDAVIERLMSVEPAPSAHAEPAAAPQHHAPAPHEQDDSLIDSLVEGEAAPEPEPEPEAPRPADRPREASASPPEEEVDLSVIDSLVDDDKERGS